MERKIGEIFEYNGEWYQCINKGFSCADCDIKGDCSDAYIGACSSSLRKDGKQVRFKKLEKVGEPIIYMSRTFQKLKSSDAEQCKYCYFGNQVCNPQLCGKESFLVEIKQDKEDMEEKKLNLKPFDIQKAREGKPVCTRDGRKARIICFDSKNDPQRPIVALVEHNDNELLYEYTIEGKERFSHISTTGTSDLMMLPEKKEGWVNVYKKEQNRYVKGIFPSREIALNSISEKSREYIDTVKINWSE